LHCIDCTWLARVNRPVTLAVRALYVMGGAERSGNSSVAAEYNFHCDPEAAHLVLLKVRKPFGSCIPILPFKHMLISSLTNKQRTWAGRQ
jgi:inosine-uridine nucleoside N-ribohydrolase